MKRALELHLPVQQPRGMVLSHLLMELTAIWAGRTVRVSGHDAFWLVLLSNTSTHCEWLTLVAMPLVRIRPQAHTPVVSFWEKSNISLRTSQTLCTVICLGAILLLSKLFPFSLLLCQIVTRCPNHPPLHLSCCPHQGARVKPDFWPASKQGLSRHHFFTGSCLCPASNETVSRSKAP